MLFSRRYKRKCAIWRLFVLLNHASMTRMSCAPVVVLYARLPALTSSLCIRMLRATRASCVEQQGPLATSLSLRWRASLSRCSRYSFRTRSARGSQRPPLTTVRFRRTRFSLFFSRLSFRPWILLPVLFLLLVFPIRFHPDLPEQSASMSASAVWVRFIG